MSSKQQQQQRSNTDSYAMITDEKKRKRMISNRESARRSRMKREQHVKDLNEQITFFTKNISEISRSIDEIGGRYTAIESENTVLRKHAHELKLRLDFLEKMVISCNNDKDLNFSEFPVMGTFEIEDSSLKPWMLSGFQSQAVDGIYQF